MKLEQGSYVTKGAKLSYFTYMFKKVSGPLIYFAALYRDPASVKAQLRPLGKCSFSLENLFNVLNKTYIKENILFVFFGHLNRTCPLCEEAEKYVLIYICIFFFLYISGLPE